MAEVNPNAKIKVAIIGSGNIGTDLLLKILRSSFLDCVFFVGRNLSSNGISKAVSLGVRVSDLGIDAFVKNISADDFSLVFDATSALSHRRHALVFEKLGKMVIDLTPSGVGYMCVPAVNLEEALRFKNINVITCGGQASIPLAYCISQVAKDVQYLEVVSAIASRSAGPATRANIDEYVQTTQRALSNFCGCKKTKTILILNPAQPCIDMQTTIFAKVKNPDMKSVVSSIQDMVRKIQLYVPGYQLIVPPVFENGRIVVMVKVKGRGDYLPSYAGNLDIINCAAVAIAEQYAKNLLMRDIYK